MISFPFDSQVTGTENVSGATIPVLDRANDATELRKIFANMFTDGISQKITNCLKVSPGTGMKVIVSPGFCNCNGAFGYESENRTLAVQSSSPTYDRIDLVVARMDNNNAYRNVDLYVVQGTASASPKAPDPTRNETVYEIVLAHVFVAKGTTSISDYRITDKRLDSSVCGLMQPTPGVDTTGIFDQYQNALDNFLQTVDDALDGTLAGSLQNQITDIKNNVLDSLSAVKSNTNQKVPAGALALKEAVTISSQTVFTNRFKTGVIYRYGNDIKRILLLDSKVYFHAGQEYELGTLPEGYRPVQKFEKYMIIAGNQSNTYIARLVIQTNGTVMLYPFVDRGVDAVIVIDEMFI